MRLPARTTRGEREQHTVGNRPLVHNEDDEGVGDRRTEWIARGRHST